MIISKNFEFPLCFISTKQEFKSIELLKSLLYGKSLMKKKDLSFLIAALSFQASSALPARFQGERGIKQVFSLLNESEYKNDALGNFESLRKKDGQYELVYNLSYYGERCTLTFGRKEVERPFGGVGPQEPLEIKGTPKCITIK